MKASDLMTTHVITAHADTTVEELARLLTRNRIGSVPIVDEERRVIGIVSESDLFLKEKGIPFSAVKLPTLFRQWVDPRQLAQVYDNARHHTAADIMTRDVVCVEHDEPVGHVAWFMMQWGVERVPVVRAERLVGLISRVDLIRMLAEPAETQAPAGESEALAAPA